VTLDERVPTETFYDWDRMCQLLAAQEPAWEPGTRHGESALFYGHLVGELIRRVDGRSLGEFLRAELCGPLGLDFQFGLSPAEMQRAVELTWFDELLERQHVAHPPGSFYWRCVGNPPGARDANVVNSARWRSAQIPAINGHGTARAMAGLYASLHNGKILSRWLLADARRVQSSGLDAVFDEQTAWALGFRIDDDGYGMGGLGGSYAGFTVAGDYAIGFVTGTLGDHQRADQVENAYRLIIGLPALN